MNTSVAFYTRIGEDISFYPSNYLDFNFIPERVWRTQQQFFISRREDLVAHTVQYQSHGRYFGFILIVNGYVLKDLKSYHQAVMGLVDDMFESGNGFVIAEDGGVSIDFTGGMHAEIDKAIDNLQQFASQLSYFPIDALNYGATKSDYTSLNVDSSESELLDALSYYKYVLIKGSQVESSDSIIKQYDNRISELIAENDRLVRNEKWRSVSHVARSLAKALFIVGLSIGMFYLLFGGVRYSDLKKKHDSLDARCQSLETTLTINKRKVCDLEERILEKDRQLSEYSREIKALKNKTPFKIKVKARAYYYKYCNDNMGLQLADCYSNEGEDGTGSWKTAYDKLYILGGNYYLTQYGLVLAADVLQIEK
ncbi:hypothetical protein [Porphyromonas levii]|uniref:Uncharacterized protein n=1 Tax=Porphyromonas levii TaxID=28114 RepID=A0A4Y8WPI4_9PORP|nr:hypothetical protein [Porphyromonas levii]TFH94332.1 hypothetical protein E4P47_07970 [Porphyromonas levii]TFH95252.1 hypothetical protein E4P48_08435 [Porphyromonas levii]